MIDIFITVSRAIPGNGLYFHCSNWNHIETLCNNNFTIKEFCQAPSSSEFCNITGSSLDKWNYSQDLKFGFWIALVLLTGLTTMKELYFFWKVRLT